MQAALVFISVTLGFLYGLKIRNVHVTQAFLLTLLTFSTIGALLFIVTEIYFLAILTLGFITGIMIEIVFRLYKTYRKNTTRYINKY